MRRAKHQNISVELKRLPYHIIIEFKRLYKLCNRENWLNDYLLKLATPTTVVVVVTVVVAAVVVVVIAVRIIGAAVFI